MIYNNLTHILIATSISRKRVNGIQFADWIESYSYV